MNCKKINISKININGVGASGNRTGGNGRIGSIWSGGLRGAMLAALAAGGTTSMADVAGYYDSPSDYYVFIPDMVDFDQRRDVGPGVFGLPADDDGNGGAMYCVPTSSSNLMAYIERHGYANNPGVAGPGNLDWANGSDTFAYNTATLYIEDMGDDMNTSGDGGTSNNNNQIFNAVRDRLDPSLFDVCYYSRTDSWSPKVNNVASWMFNAGIVQWCYGRWLVGGADDTPYERQGGHCVVMTKVDKRDFMGYAERDYRINFANPSNGSNTLTQANFFSQVEDCTNFNYFNANPGVFRMMTRINFDINDPNDTRHRIMDSALAIFPKQGFGSSNDGSLWLGSNSLNWGGGDPDDDFGLTTYDVPGGFPVFRGGLTPDRGSAAYLTAPAAGGPSILYHLNLVTGESTPVSEINAPTGFVFHRDRTLFYANQSQLRRIEIDQDLPEHTRRLEWSTTLGSHQTCDALAFDDEMDELWVLSASTGEILCYDDELTGIQRRYQIPRGIELGANPGMALNGDRLLLTDEDEAVVYRITMTDLLVSSYQIGGSSGDGAIGDDGHIFLIQDGKVQEFVEDGDGGLKRVEDASMFAGLPAGGFFEISRSRTNFVAELHSGPGWENVDPSVESGEEVPPCPVDLARPFEVLDIFDVLAYLERFESGHPSADLAAPAGVLDIFDVIEFLGMFESGCGQG